MIRLERAQRVHLSQVVFEQFLAKIRNGSLRPGDRLPGEYELMAQVGVGRSSVREAMRGLVALGLVETKPGRGAVVLDATRMAAGASLEGGSAVDSQKWALLDLLEVREGLEGMAAQLAAQRATAADLTVVERAERSVEARVAKNLNYFRANLGFHLAVARASHNGLLVDSLSHILKDVRIQRERLVRDVARAGKGASSESRAVLSVMQQNNPATLVEHRTIVKAIRQKDAAAARLAMEGHIRHTAAMGRCPMTDDMAALARPAHFRRLASTDP